MNSDARTSRARWEYRQFHITPVDKLMARLEAEGRDGWELVCVVVEEPYYRAFLRRPLPTEESFQ